MNNISFSIRPALNFDFDFIRNDVYLLNNIILSYIISNIRNTDSSCTYIDLYLKNDNYSFTNDTVKSLLRFSSIKDIQIRYKNEDIDFIYTEKAAPTYDIFQKEVNALFHKNDLIIKTDRVITIGNQII